MSCMRGCWLVLFVWMLSGCADHSVKTSHQNMTAALPDETVSFSHLGQFWCLLDVDSLGKASTREQIREVDLDDWQAFESTVLGSSTDYATCDAGAIKFINGGGACAAPSSNQSLNPAGVVLSDPFSGRISVVRIPGTTTFQVSLKDITTGLVIPQLGSFVMTPSPGFTAAGMPVRYKWLSARVTWETAGSKVTYDIFLYLVDKPGVRDLPKIYRIEFFRRNETACIDEEPVNGGYYSGPHAENGIVCANLESKSEQKHQAPIGDGHHHPPTAANSCVY